MSKCQACEKIKSMIELKDLLDKKNPAYRVCMNCLIPLVNLSLSPEQFRNLIRNGHSVNEYLLHDDFYDEDGVAQQPRGR